jgi:hypothetical protein
MPRIMTVVFSMEIIIKPDTTHMLFDHSLPRRIYTEGRDWPRDIEPSFLGYSIGSGSTRTATAAMTRWRSRPAA